jgi:hypothetical protein
MHPFLCAPNIDLLSRCPLRPGSSIELIGLSLTLDNRRTTLLSLTHHSKPLPQLLLQSRNRADSGQKRHNGFAFEFRISYRMGLCSN